MEFGMKLWILLLPSYSVPILGPLRIGDVSLLLLPDTHHTREQFCALKLVTLLPRRPASSQSRPLLGRGIVTACSLTTEELENFLLLPPTSKHPSDPVTHPWIKKEVDESRWSLCVFTNPLSFHWFSNDSFH